MTVFLIIVSHLVVGLAAYQMGRGDELLDIIKEEREEVQP